jgi:uncharacterized protein (DUF58 family)
VGQPATSKSAVSLPHEGRLWLICAVGLWLVGWWKSINLIVLLAWVMLALLLLSWFLARRMTYLVRVEREPIESTYVGSPVQIRYRLSAQTRFDAVGFWVEDNLGGVTLRRFVARLPAGQTQTIAIDFVPQKRGRVRTDGLMIVSQYPFGILTARLWVKDRFEAIFWPRTGTLHTARLLRWLARRTRGDGRSHCPRRALVAQDADSHSVRPYRPGDSMRWIHWRTSARCGELMVRESDEKATTELVLVVEPRPGPALEALLSLAATICREWLRHPANKLTLIIARAVVETHTGKTDPETARRYLDRLAVEQGGEPAELQDLLEAVTAVIVGRAVPVLYLTSEYSERHASQASGRLVRPIAWLTPEQASEFYTPPAG